MSVTHAPLNSTVQDLMAKGPRLNGEHLDRSRSENGKTGKTPLVSTGLTFDQAASLLKDQIEWTKNNFYQELVKGLQAVGLPTEDIENNRAAIMDRVNHGAKGVKLGEIDSYAQHLGNNTIIGFNKIAEKAAELQKQNSQITPKELHNHLSLFIRDTLVHEMMHHLQPSSPEIPDQEWLEGGAECLSNLLLAASNSRGKVTYQTFLVLLSQSLFESKDPVENTSLQKAFVKYSLLGFSLGERETADLVSTLDTAILKTRRQFESRFDGCCKLLGYDFKTSTSQPPKINPEALSFLATATYDGGKPEQCIKRLRTEFQRQYDDRLRFEEEAKKIEQDLLKP